MATRKATVKAKKKPAAKPVAKKAPVKKSVKKAAPKAVKKVVNETLTMNATLARVYDAWHDARLREFWLPGAPLEVQRSTDGKSMRITWTLGNSNVDVSFAAKGADKSTVQVEHSKLSDAEAIAAQKVYWSEGLERLRAWLETGVPKPRAAKKR